MVQQKPKTRRRPQAKNKQQKITKVKKPDQFKLIFASLCQKVKNKKNKEILNESIEKGLVILKQNQDFHKEITGSKLAQFILKYGKKSHKDDVNLLVAQKDLEVISKNIYSSFIITKCFRYADSGKGFSLIRKYFVDNFWKMLPNQQHHRALNAFINSLDKKKQLKFMFSENFKLNPTHQHKILMNFLKQSQFRNMIISYYLIYFSMDEMEDDQLKQLMGTFMPNINYLLEQNSNCLIFIVILSKIFDRVNMKNKKVILREILSQNFMKFYEKEPNFVYFLLSFLQRIKDQNVINITVMKNIRLNFSKFFESVNFVKLMLIFVEDPQKLLQKEIIFIKHPLSNEIFNVDQALKEERFIANYSYVQQHLLQSNMLLPFFEFGMIKQRIQEHSLFSRLYSKIFSKIAQDDQKRDVVEKFVLGVFGGLEDKIERYEKEETFIESPNGSRLVKSIILSLKEASDQNKEIIESQIGVLIEKIKHNPLKMASSRAIFILIAIIENSQHSSTLITLLKSSQINQLDSTQKGTQILLSLLNNQLKYQKRS